MPDDAPEGTSTVAAASLAEDRAVVRRHVAALNDGDVDAAMDLRCASARVAADRRGLFAEDVDRLTTATGPITVTSVVAGRRTGLDPGEPQPNPREVRYYLAVGGRLVEEPLLAVLVREPGRRRLCAVSTPQAETFQRERRPTIGDRGETEHEPRELAPDLDAPGYRQVADEAPAPRTALGETTAWQRIWQHEIYGGVTFFASRFTAADAARTNAEQAVNRVLSDAVEVFLLADAPGAVGVRFLGFAWLWLQPPSHGPYIDLVAIPAS